MPHLAHTTPALTHIKTDQVMTVESHLDRTALFRGVTEPRVPKAAKNCLGDKSCQQISFQYFGLKKLCLRVKTDPTWLVYSQLGCL